jgi:ABC-type branched-subunit amino acid transport system ATPase component
VTGSSNTQATPALTVSDVSVRFGGIDALSGVGFSAPCRSVTGLVGPNGAGKSTAFGVLSGLIKPSRGRVELHGVDITHIPPHSRARRGLARTFQQPELFAGLSVRDHLVLADRVRHQRRRVWTDTFLAGALRRPSSEEMTRVDELLELLGLGPIASKSVDGLPLGTSRLVEIARALATRPSVLLLDEPLSGLTSAEAEAVGRTLLQAVDDLQIAVVLVEHDMPMVLRLCSSIIVLDFGRVIASGPAAAVRDDPAVRAAYLGDGDVNDAPAWTP